MLFFNSVDDTLNRRMITVTFLEADIVQKCNRITFKSLGDSWTAQNAWYQKFVFQTFYFKSIDGKGNDVYAAIHIVEGIKLEPRLFLCKFIYGKDVEYWGVRLSLI